MHLLQVAALAGHVEANFLMGHSEAQVGGWVGGFARPFSALKQSPRTLHLPAVPGLLSAAAFRSTPPIADVAYNVLFAKPIL